MNYRQNGLGIINWNELTSKINALTPVKKDSTPPPVQASNTSAVNSTLFSLQTTIKGLQTQASQLNTEKASLQANAKSIQTQLNQQVAENSTLKETIKTLNAQLNQHVSNETSLQQNVVSQGEEISHLKTSSPNGLLVGAGLALVAGIIFFSSSSKKKTNLSGITKGEKKSKPKRERQSK